jgi:hypothetical protein
MIELGSELDQLSQKMRKLLEELQQQVGLTVAHEYRSSELLIKIYYQGEDDGLSKDEIRNLIVSTLKAVKGLKDRQIRNLLPPELKHTEKANKGLDSNCKDDAAMIAASENNTTIYETTREREYDLRLTEEEIENILNLMEVQPGEVFASAIQKFREVMNE